MPDSFPFPIYSGLMEPKHYKQIGSAIWLFLWCVSSTTKEKDEDGITWGVVLGNKPIRLSELAKLFKVNEKTVSRWLEALEAHQYIRVTRAPYGLILNVKNSKKFNSQRSDKNVHSPPTDQTNLSVLFGTEQTETSDLPDNNVRSNKDITEINNAAVVVKDSAEIMKLSHEVELHFCLRRKKGEGVSPLDFAEIQEMVADGLPLQLIKDCIDKSFAEYKPRHKRDEIRSITYCIPRCYDEWAKMQVDESITTPLPPGVVALGSPAPRGKNSQADKASYFAQKAREARGEG